MRELPMDSIPNHKNLYHTVPSTPSLLHDCKAYFSLPLISFFFFTGWCVISSYSFYVSFPTKIVQVNVHTASYLPKDMLRIQTCSRAMECIVSLLCYQPVSQAEFKTYSKYINKWLKQLRQNKSSRQTDQLYLHVGDRVMCILCVEEEDALMPWSQPSLYRASILTSMTQSRQLKGHKKLKASGYMVIASDQTVCSKLPSRLITCSWTELFTQIWPVTRTKKSSC